MTNCEMKGTICEEIQGWRETSQAEKPPGRNEVEALAQVGDEV